MRSFILTFSVVLYGTYFMLYAFMLLLCWPLTLLRNGQQTADFLHCYKATFIISQILHGSSTNPHTKQCQVGNEHQHMQPMTAGNARFAGDQHKISAPVGC